MNELIVVVQTLAGGVALLGGITAVTLRWLRAAHHWHVRAGMTTLVAIVVLALAWLVRGIADDTLAPVLTAGLMLYTAVSGWRHARRGAATLHYSERIAAWLVLLAGMALIGYGVNVIVSAGELAFGLMLFGFGTLIAMLSGLDVRAHHSDEAYGRSRIVNHLGMTITACFGATTSLAFTLASTQVAIVVTIAALFMAVHLIVYWSSRVLTSGVPDIRS